MGKVKLYITISNLMTYRNIFYTKLHSEMLKKFNCIFIIDYQIYNELDLIKQLEDKVSFIPYKGSDRLIYRGLYRFNDLCYNALLLNNSKSRSMMLNLFSKKHALLVKFIAKYRLATLGLFFAKLTLKIILPSNKKLKDNGEYALLYTLPQSFLDFFVAKSMNAGAKKTFSLIFSWDNITSRGPLLYEPNHFIVWNEFVKREIIKYYKSDVKSIHVCGMPQNEILQQFSKNKKEIQLEFRLKHNIPEKKKIILYTTGETSYLNFEPSLIQEISSYLDSSKYEFFIRLHPLDNISNYPSFELNRILLPSSINKKLLNGHEYFFTKNDLGEYAKLLNAVDCVMNIASTVALESLSIKTPVINIAFPPDTFNEESNISIDEVYNSDHFSKIIAYNVIPIVKNKEDMCRKIDELIQDPNQLFNKNYDQLMLDFFADSTSVAQKTVKAIYENL